MRIPLVAIILTAAVFTGCSDTRSVSLPVRGVMPLNPNQAKESLSVDVRIHPLSSDARYRAATVDQLWTDAKSALGPELLSEPTKITVFPGSPIDPAMVHTLTMPEATRFIGVLAMYQGSDAQDNRAIVVPVADAERLGLVFTGYGVALAAPKP